MRHLFFLWAGWAKSPKMDPPELFIHLGGAIGNPCLLTFFLSDSLVWVKPGRDAAVALDKGWLRIQRMVKDSTGGQGLNGWTRTQRVVNPFSRR